MFVFQMLISVLSVILVKALQKEEKFNYNRWEENIDPDFIFYFYN